MFKFEAELWPRRGQREAFGPFEDYHRWTSEQVFETEGFEIVERFDAVQVAVVNLVGVSIDMIQSKGWAGDLVFLGGAQPSDDAFGQSSFSAAEVAGQ